MERYDDLLFLFIISESEYPLYNVGSELGMPSFIFGYCCIY
jgi:hypothetical protein